MSRYQEELSTIGAAADAEIADLQAALDEATKPEPPTPKPEPAGMLVGSSLYRESGEDHQEAYDRRCAQWGVTDMDLIRYFWPGMPVNPPWPQLGNSQAITSFKPGNVAAFARGDDDTLMNVWLDVLPHDKKPRRVAIWHEREDDIEAGRFTKDQARAMDTKMRDLVDAGNARNGTNVRFGLILMGWTLNPRSGRDIGSYLPVNGWQYDWFGWDAYPGDTADQDVPDLSATKELYGWCSDFSRSQKRPWYVCETGTRPAQNQSADVYDERQAAWITGATQIARDLGCKGWTYFDSTVGGDFRIKGPLASAAMKAAIEHVTLAGNIITAEALYPPLDDR